MQTATVLFNLCKCEIASEPLKLIDMFVYSTVVVRPCITCNRGWGGGGGGGGRGGGAK